MTSSKLMGSDFEDGGSNSSASDVPIIVGVVVGVVGGLALLALGLWLWRFKKHQHKEYRHPLLPNPYHPDAVHSELLKSAELELRRSGSAAPSTRDSLPDSSSGHHVPLGRLGRNESGLEVVEFLPPQYQDNWQLPPAPPLLSPMPSPGPSGPPFQRSSSSASSRSVPAQQSSSTLKNEYMLHVPERVALKQEYVRMFDWPSHLGREVDLQEQYKSAFSFSSSNLNQCERPG